MKRRLFVASATAGVAAGLVPALGQAQANAAKYIVPYPPGGPTDVIGRIMAHGWGAASGKTVMVENKAGAAGSIGMDMLIRSPADGNTLCTLASATLLANLMGGKLNFDPLTGYTPVCMGYEIPLVMVVSAKQLPHVTSVDTLREAAGAESGKLNYSTSSYGSAAHLLAESLQGAANFRMTYVPYKGAAPALQGMLAGDISVFFADLFTVMPHIKSGNLRPIVVGSQKRVAELPQVPTLIESGFNFHATSWNAVAAPPGLPAKVLQELQQQFSTALNDSDIKRQIANAGASAAYMPAAQLKEFIASEYASWQRIIRERNIKPQV